MRKMKLCCTVLALLICLSAQTPVSVKPYCLDITSKILEANKGNHFLVQGDIALSNKRNAMKCLNSYCKWKKSYNGLVEVPYSFSNYFYDDEKALIEKAMETFHQKTCVRFVPHRDQRDYLQIESELGCWTTIGRDGGQQVVSLSVHGCLDHGVIQHELLHALGFHHEHTRSDRDQFVRINWENVAGAHASNFHKADTNNLNTPYDYSSIMHYGRTAFAKMYGQETITPITDPSVPIGQREEMSDIDILRVNRLYECSEYRNPQRCSIFTKIKRLCFDVQVLCGD
uniref:Metalloendopeptidase n=1 Tax=Mola mola TaxID=94237 RepID=A0A3Q4BZ91_MOLML